MYLFVFFFKQDDFSDSTNSDDESEKCPICLRKFIEQEVGVPGCCEHNFCGACIAKWAEVSILIVI